MITQVPMAGETVTWDGSLTGIQLAVKWLLSVSVHGMGLAFVAEKACGGREACIGARRNLAAVWFQVRIDAFTVVIILACVRRKRQWTRTHSCTSTSRACGCIVRLHCSPMGNDTVHLVQPGHCGSADDSWQHCLNPADSCGDLLFRLWKFLAFLPEHNTHRRRA